jgi:hypothetical protein
LAITSGIKNFGYNRFALGIFKSTLRNNSLRGDIVRISHDDEDSNILRFNKDINSSNNTTMIRQKSDNSQFDNIH